MVSKMKEPLSEALPALLAWARLNGRRPYWRDGHGPFAVAVAELLLQKTKAGPAAEVWTTLMGQFPEPEALAQAPTPLIKGIVGKLGLVNQRAQRLQAMSAAVAARVPWSDLPGLGTYGGAIVTLVAGEDPPDCAPVDGNIARVLSRLEGLSFQRGEPRKKPEVRNVMRDLLASLPDPSSKLQLLYALVDLGEAVCKPRTPDCESCPLAPACSHCAGSAPPVSRGTSEVNPSSGH